MTEKDRAAVEAAIRQEWPGERYLPRHGRSVFPPVRDGGATDALIKLAAEIADRHYSGTG